jgi:hypothetical protein
MALSSYTIAKNCTDLTDIQAGLDEIKQYFRYCEKKNKKPLQTAYTRLAKLEWKKSKATK